MQLSKKKKKIWQRIQVLQDVMPCHWAVTSKHFEGSQFLQHQAVLRRILTGLLEPEDEVTLILQNLSTHSTTQCHIPKDLKPESWHRHCENLISCGSDVWEYKETAKVCNHAFNLTVSVLFFQLKFSSFYLVTSAYIRFQSLCLCVNSKISNLN